MRVAPFLHTMPAAMPDAGSTVALVHADPALGAAVALHTGAALVRGAPSFVPRG